jgi:subtilisin family serine protease
MSALIRRSGQRSGLRAPLRHRSRARATGALALLALLAACGGGDGGTGPGPDVSRADTLVGAADDPAVAAVPRVTYESDESEFATGHPSLPGLPQSVATALVTLAPDARLGDVNGALRSLRARIVGGIPGRAGAASAVLALRLETAGHAEMEQALGALRATPGVLEAVQDARIEPLVITRSPTTPLPTVTWLWETSGDPRLDNWGLMALRVPQLWNLNARLAAEGAPTTDVGVLDEGYVSNHEDLEGVFELDGINVTAAHGTEVAGIIAARVGDRRGIDGVTPFARVLGRTWKFSVGDAMWGLDLLLRERPQLLVVNISLGYRWRSRSPAGDPLSVEAATRASRDGRVVRDGLTAIAGERGGRLPFIVAAAGNDGLAGTDVPAAVGSPFASAALVHGVEAITVVEADAGTLQGSSAQFRRADFSNVGGQLSAPGVGVGTTSGPARNAYTSLDGTSFAAPLVAGAAAYLFTLMGPAAANDFLPTLERNRMRELLVDARHVSADRGGRPQVDAFGAALLLDAVLSREVTLPRLLDVDDGTPDGNRRVDPFSGAVVTTDNPLADGLTPRIDMADFRRWRDWLLQVEDEAAAAALDGAPDHPKKDPNGDGFVETAAGGSALENIFPRGDFNGDGLLSRTRVARLPGPLTAVGPLTDLQVLQRRFVDDDYDASELDDLLESGDIAVRTTGCAPGTTASMRAIAERTGSPVFAHTFAPGESEYVMTVPAPAGTEAAWQVRTQLTGLVSGLRVADRVDTVRLRRGGDAPLVPTCERIGGVWSGTFNATFTPDEGGGSRESPGTLEFRMNVNGNFVSGDATLVSFFGPGTGRLTGSRVGTTISNFNFDATNTASGCRGDFEGTAQVDATAGTMTVSYTGDDCNGIITNGRATLTRISD